MARENSSWGYDRIAGALQNLGHNISDQTIGKILRRYGISPAPKRRQTDELGRLHSVSHVRVGRH